MRKEGVKENEQSKREERVKDAAAWRLGGPSCVAQEPHSQLEAKEGTAIIPQSSEASHRPASSSRAYSDAGNALLSEHPSLIFGASSFGNRPSVAVSYTGSEARQGARLSLSG